MFRHKRLPSSRAIVFWPEISPQEESTSYRIVGRIPPIKLSGVLAIYRYTGFASKVLTVTEFCIETSYYLISYQQQTLLRKDHWPLAMWSETDTQEMLVPHLHQMIRLKYNRRKRQSQLSSHLTVTGSTQNWMLRHHPSSQHSPLDILVLSPLIRINSLKMSQTREIWSSPLHFLSLRTPVCDPMWCQ